MFRWRDPLLSGLQQDGRRISGCLHRVAHGEKQTLVSLRNNTHRDTLTRYDTVLMDSRELREACTECEAETFVASILRICSEPFFKATPG